MRRSIRAAGAACVAMLAMTGVAVGQEQNPVATTDDLYTVFGRAFPDPQGCGVNEIDEVPAVSPWAKGNVCATQFLTYNEMIAGTRFLESRHSRFLQVIRLDEAYDDPSMMSAGIPKSFQLQDNEVRVNGREKRPLYLFKVTDKQSPIPEKDRKHFAISMSIHGIERAGLEGGIRAMEDLVTWAHCEVDTASSPACANEGPFPKKIVETPTDKPVPTAGDTLKNSVIYFFDVNPDGWGRGEVANGGAFFQRYNGNSVDINRDWPTLGYTFKPYSPGSEPETKAYAKVLMDIKDKTSEKRFTGGIDLHGQRTGVGFSYTLLGAGQRDFRRNFSSVDQALRTWSDQSQRLGWSPYITDFNRNGQTDAGEPCSGTFCVADQWGTVVDTLGYQITGGIGDWMDSDALGLGGVGIDNEMSLSHLVPNIGYEHVNEQMHVDGNKGLIYSQLAALLYDERENWKYTPPGKVGYVFNEKRISQPGGTTLPKHDLPTQNSLDVLLPCATVSECGGGRFVPSGDDATLEFEVKGPDDGYFNAGLTVITTFPNANGISAASAANTVALDHYDEGTWHTIATSRVSESTYLTGGQITTANDPAVGRWRVRINTGMASLPARVQLDFRRDEAESGPTQKAFSASSMDFFDELNRYIPAAEQKLEPVTVRQVIDDYASLKRLDSLVVVNEALPEYADAAGNPLQLTDADRQAYFANLKRYAQDGGNLVLTDGALKAAATLGLVPAASIKSTQPSGSGAVPRVEFNLGGTRGNLCTPTTTDLLAKDVCLPGTAGGNLRQVMEPTPLGYTPDTSSDSANNNKLTQFHIDRAAWEAGCGAACTSGRFVTPQNVELGAALGRKTVGLGEVRIAGALLPDPKYNPNQTRDMRFGVASYALAPAGWQMFLNLVNYQRPKADLSVEFTTAPGTADAGRETTWVTQVGNAGPRNATNTQLQLTLPAGIDVGALPQGCSGAPIVVCQLGTLPVGATRALTFTGTPTGPGSLSATAVVSSFELDPNAANDRARSGGQAACSVTGTAGNDTLSGTRGADVICGLGGNDTIKLSDGDDILLGGEGDDSLSAGYGDDLVVGGPGRDWHNGGPGVDTCRRVRTDDVNNSNCER